MGRSIESRFVVPLDAAPVGRSATGSTTDSTLFPTHRSVASLPKNDDVLECGGKASTPLWSSPKGQTHPLPIRIPIRSPARREEPRNPQCGHLRP